MQVSVASQPDSAQEGEDYAAVIVSLTLQPNEVKTCVIVEVPDDDLVEGNEAFRLIVTSHDQAVVITTPDVTTIQILDNDGKSIA